MTTRNKNSEQPSLWEHISSRPVVTTALKVALVVGTILALINHGPTLVEGTLTMQQWLQIALTYLVPYCVSTYSSIKMLSLPPQSDSDFPDKSKR